MKKSIILFLIIALTQSLTAQNNQTTPEKAWFDIQISQHIGLNSWSNASYVNDGLPATTITELRGVLNILISKKYIGGFVDIGAGIMPAPKMQSLNLAQMPMPYSGTKYYLREILSESGSCNTSVNVKMTFGLFGKLSVNENLTVMPCLGYGFLTLPKREFEVILKEHGSNMQYQTKYIWNSKGKDEYGEPPVLGYCNGRLNFKYKLSAKTSLLFGLEYTWFLNTLDFYGKYTNTFNENVERDFTVKGNKVNMFGISAGISFM